MRLLVVIASFGQKNMAFLQGIIRTYRAMPMEVDVIVVSEGPKELGPDVKVVVGLPTPNPWSLPFAHKPVLAANVERYDLFAYSEDDMDVTLENIKAFVDVAGTMKEDEVPGFLRYELAPDGSKVLTDVHGAFHWKADSAKRCDPRTFAEFTNEHAAFYLLTKAQLKRALNSGNYLRPPSEGRYGLPETAATEPYTCCGLRKVICISALDNFLIRHMSNLYVGRHGISLERFKEQVSTLELIASGDHPKTQLVPVEPKLLQREYHKSYYENVVLEILDMVPSAVRNILSIGSGWGATEEELKKRGAAVTAMPLDSVMGAEAARKGIKVIYGELGSCLDNLGSQQFDCLLILNLLHLQSDPAAILDRCARHVAPGGTMVVSSPNFHTAAVLAKMALGRGDFGKLKTFSASGINVITTGMVLKRLKSFGFRNFRSAWFDEAKRPQSGFRLIAKPLFAQRWAIQAQCPA
jgi:SAM-dependent methyltransferase